MGLNIIYNLIKTTPFNATLFMRFQINKWLQFIIFKYSGPEFYLFKDSLLPFLKFCKLQTLIRIKSMVDLCVVDFPFKKARFRLSYNFLSVYSIRFIVNIFVGLQDVVISLKSVFKSADWLEREAWDMYGVFFFNHNDLRRILTDYGFRGFPFRKDFPLTGYIELRFDETRGDITYEPVELAQELRFFNFSSGWECDN